MNRGMFKVKHRETEYVNKKQYPYLFYIEWIDNASFSDAQWVPLEDVQALRPVLITTVGWVLSEDDVSIRLSPTLDAGMNTYGTVVVVKACIVKAVKLRNLVKWMKKD